MFSDKTLIDVFYPMFLGYKTRSLLLVYNIFQLFQILQVSTGYRNLFGCFG